MFKGLETHFEALYSLHYIVRIELVFPLFQRKILNTTLMRMDE